MSTAWKVYATLFVLGWVGGAVLAYGLLWAIEHARARWRRRRAVG